MLAQRKCIHGSTGDGQRNFREKSNLSLGSWTDWDLYLILWVKEMHLREPEFVMVHANARFLQLHSAGDSELVVTSFKAGDTQAPYLNMKALVSALPWTIE